MTTVHAQFTRPDQIPKYVEYEIRPSFYTLHTYYFAEARIANRGKEQAMYISPMRKLGAPVWAMAPTTPDRSRVNRRSLEGLRPEPTRAPRTLRLEVPPQKV